MKKKMEFYFFILIISFVCVFICSKNSTLYVFNDWVDENAFMTVGKSWAHGIIPYRDLFEQKGPFLYFIFMLASLINETSFTGVFILEIVFFFCTLVFLSKIIELYCNEKYNYYILPIFSCILTTSSFFYHGGSAEEFSIPFLVYSLYILLKLFKTGKVTNKEMFFVGLCAGFITMIKFNLLGFWIGFGIVLVVNFFKNKDYKNEFKRIFVFIIGMSIPIIIFTSYFIINGAFKDFVKTYFLFNARNYSAKVTIYERIKKDFDLYYSQLTSNFKINILTFIGMFCFLFTNDYIKEKYYKLLFFITYIGSFFGIFFGGFTYSYYFLFMVPFILLGLIVIIDYLYKNYLVKNRIINILFILVIITFFVMTIKSSPNISFKSVKKEDLVQFKYAKIIKKEKNPKILNFGFLDGGFYLASDILPSTKYFELQNAVVPGMTVELDEKIINKNFDFIIVRTYEGFDPRYESIYNNYDEIKCDIQKFENTNFTYYLYKKKVD